MRVRQARNRDLEALHPLLEQLMKTTPGGRRAMLAAALRHEGYAAWVVEVAKTPVGFVDVFVFPDAAHGHRIGLVNNLVVDTRFRGRGLGERLLRTAIAHCRKRRAAELHVWTGFANAPAIGAYRKLGFVERGPLLEMVLTPKRAKR